MDFDLVIRNGTVVTASDIWESCDIGIKDGTIVAIGPSLPVAPGAQEIDAEGAFITPGGVDAHVHLSQFYEATVGVDIDHSIITNGVVPNPENFVGDTFITGTRSAVAGGTTTVIMFASQMKKDESIITVIEDYHKLTKDQSYCDYAFHVIITNPTPQIVENEFPWMDIYPGDFEGAKCVCSPPIREDKSNQDSMWAGVKNGTFTIVSSEHSPTKFNHPNGKQRGLKDGNLPYGKFRLIPNGLPGVKTRVPLLFSGGVLSGRISPQKFVEVTSTNPAKLYGLKKKGSIAPGFDADLVIWYPQTKFQSFNLTNEMLHHAVDYTPFEGIEFKNWPRYTIIRGKVVFSHGEVVGEMEYGQYIWRQKSLLPGPRDVWLSEWRP
ncbi:hypothetical protein BDR07DRAFT_1381282 [Suillus spraguei]|nr:hypothetical protein BDR07DRAFT_1381282 [Suillus spraguei]